MSKKVGYQEANSLSTELNDSFHTKTKAFETRELFSMRIGITLAIFCLAFLLAGSLSFEFPDFQDHSKAAERISRGELLYRDHIRYLSVYHYPPVFLYTLGGLYAVIGVNLFAAKGLLVFFNLLAALLLYRIARNVLNEKDAFVCFFLFLVNPLTFSAVYAGYFDNFVMVFLLLSLLLLFNGKPVMGGAALAIASMSKPFPVLLLVVLIPFYLKQQRTGFLFKAISVFVLTSAVISVPFLLLAPGEFLYYAFFYNFERSSQSLSLYYYFFPMFETRFFPFGLQVIFLGWLSLRMLRSKTTEVSFLLRSILFLFVGFFVLNRINYPHYLIYTVPFFSVILVEEYRMKTRFFRIPVWKHLTLAFGLMLLGSLIWSYPWSLGIYDFKSSSYFWAGSVIFFTGSFFLLMVLYRSCRSFRSKETHAFA